MKYLLWLALLVAVAAPVASGAGSKAPKASVAVIDDLPVVVVAGNGFKPREQITVSVTRGGKFGTKKVVASVTGAFRARFGFAGNPDSCLYTLVRATGSKGTTAVMRTMPAPCVPLAP